MPTDFENSFFAETEEKNKTKIPEPLPIDEILKLADTPIPWLVENLLIQGGCSLLAAKPKVGKTTFSRCLALAVARGEPFLGQKTVKGKVLLMTLEDKLSEVGRHFRLLGADEKDHIFVLTESPRSIPQLRTLISDNKFELVVIDTMILGVRGLADLNDYLLVSQAIAPYVQLARETESHIMFCHHLSKRERGGGDQILGSTALFGAVDIVLLLDRQKQRRVFSTIARYGSDWPNSDLEIEESGALTLRNVVSTESPIRDQILDCISKSDSPMTEKQIESLVYGRTSEKRKELRLLLSSGLIFRHGTGSKNRPFQYSSRP